MTSKLNAISLGRILDGDDAAIASVNAALTRRGWTFVQLPEPLSSEATEAAKFFDKFLQETPDDRKYGLRDGQFGYRSFMGKETIRFPTGTEQVNVPKSLEPLTKLSASLDSYLLQVTAALSPSLFGMTFNTLQHNHSDIFPLLRGQDSELPAFALFDAVKYSPKIGENCAAHYDPGLLTLSVRSSSAGLLLQDENGKWIEGPIGSDVGVVWAGYAAKELLNDKIVPAVHKVELPGKSTRVAIWSELATQSQVLPNHHSIGSEGKVSFETPTMLLVPNLGEEPYKVRIVKGDVASACELVEELKGLPYSKLMRYVYYNGDGDVTGTGTSPNQVEIANNKTGCLCAKFRQITAPIGTTCFRVKSKLSACLYVYR